MRFNRVILINLFAGIALAAISVYLILRVSLFFIASYQRADKFFTLVLLFGELFLLIHAVGYVLNIMIAVTGQGKKQRQDEVASVASKKNPPVAILVAARHEPRQVLEETFLSIKNLNYENKTIYFLDDSTDQKYKDQAEQLSRDYGLVLFRSKLRHGAKAGILNDCLKTLNEKYVVMFDADQNPISDFLDVLVPIMEKDERLSFIQTPQFYTNIGESRVARASSFQQCVFYEYICEGKSTGGSMFCCGTNIIFRR